MKYIGILKIIIVGVIIFLCNCYLYQICIIHGNSMNPTLFDKNVIIIKKFNLKLNYNDIIAIKKNNRVIIKRIIGLPGDIVYINHYPYVNGQKFDDLYIEDCGDNNDIKLSNDEYFVLGDNRQESIDSRFDEIGIIKKGDIIGKMMKKEGK